jgi:pyruvate,water dikinase
MGLQLAADPLPDWFVGHPDDIPLAPASGRDHLEGWAAGPGRIEGTVRIVASLDDGTRLNDGDVLVAHATDPSWTPLLLAAGAIVLETGGPLAHAAIVARELGLPAVLNVSSATRILRDGETVRVDGTRGVVDRLDPGGN